MPEADDEIGEIATDCRAFRLIRPDWVKNTPEGLRPSSQGFQNHPDDKLMSVYLEDEILLAKVTVYNLLEMERWKGYYACWLLVGELRDEFGQEVFRDPQEDFPGHGSVRHPGKDSRPQSVRTKMAIRARWVDDPAPRSMESA